MLKNVCLYASVFVFTLCVSTSVGQSPRESKPSDDDRIAALENEVAALKQRLDAMERLAEHQDEQLIRAYSLSNDDAASVRDSVERLLTRSVKMGLKIGVDTRSNRIVGTGTEIQLSQLGLLVTLIDSGLIQP